MDYFGGLTERVIDAPMVLRPLLPADIVSEQLEEEYVDISQAPSGPTAVPPETIKVVSQPAPETPQAEPDKPHAAPPPSAEPTTIPLTANIPLEPSPAQTPVANDTRSSEPKPEPKTAAPAPFELPTHEKPAKHEPQPEIPHQTVEAKSEPVKPNPTPAALEAKPSPPQRRVIEIRSNVSHETEPSTLPTQQPAPVAVQHETRIIGIPNIDPPTVIETRETETEKETVKQAIHRETVREISTQEASPAPPTETFSVRPEPAQNPPEPIQKPERNLVEIHIGRIEVRPPAAQPPRPVSKPRSGRLNLDDVLSRRRSGR